MKTCDICGKKMPGTVLEAHKAKRHSQEVQTRIEKPAKVFDWGEVYPCAQCGEEYPAKAMPFHSRVKHGV